MTIDNLQGFVRALITKTVVFDYPAARESTGLIPTVIGEMQCPGCGEMRHIEVCLLYRPAGERLASAYSEETMTEALIPSIATGRCVQCDTAFTFVTYPGSSGPDLAVLPSKLGGLATAHTSAGVAYYLDQAGRAASVGARSAAVAMYRGALEHLLFEQGYTDGMLASKISDLEKAITAGTAPAWALDLETEFLQAIKDLGNASIHPNDGDVTKQAHLDDALLSAVRETFHLLLFLIYETRHEKSIRLSALRAKARLLKK
jgi:hypothetical protein